jgi:formate hydrogenlyase subunit 3/multisubunit Na+/H+ antiporter MnhD subunit
MAAGAAQTAAKMSAASSSGGGFFAEFQERIVARDPNTIGILVACLVGLLTLVFIFLWTKRRIFGRGHFFLILFFLLCHCCVVYLT